MPPLKRTLVLLSVLVIALLGILESADAGNFQIKVFKKDGTLTTDGSSLVVKNSLGTPVTPSNLTFSNGTHTFLISPPVGGDGSLEFTVTRGSVTKTSKGYWAASPKNPSIIFLVVDAD